MRFKNQIAYKVGLLYLWAHVIAVFIRRLVFFCFHNCVMYEFSLLTYLLTYLFYLANQSSSIVNTYDLERRLYRSWSSEQQYRSPTML